ncbi:MAG: hypothetical protein P8188_11790 [Gemmatimonadota bacterium]
MKRRLAILLALLGSLALAPRPGAAQGVDGSIGGGLVGGVAAGTAALWAFYPFSGCAMVTVGPPQPSDACDVFSVVALLAGTATGAVLGARDRHVGYGMGIGWVAGFGTGWLLGRVVDTPRWVDALFLVGGVVAGGYLGSEYGDDPPLEGEPNALEVFRLELIRF